MYYSRQYTEEVNVSQTSLDLFHDIYRYPKYPGPAAMGYRAAYDIYSLGPILAEIAWWMPLQDLLEAESKRSCCWNYSVRKAKVSRKVFLCAVQRELAYRVGHDMVTWGRG
jgi:hypothetical protein